MTDRELATAARAALSNIENERDLLANPLLPQNHAFSYGTVRFVVLSALQSLEPVGTGPAVRKQRRMHGILVRCDLGGEHHKAVVTSMAISRRQFYRERHEALVGLAERIRSAVAGALQRPGQATTTRIVDLGDAGEAFLEALRSAGQYREVWNEATSLATQNAGEPREAELWLVASEAARFFADRSMAGEALERARQTKPTDSFWRSLWIASSAMNLAWLDAHSQQARVTFEAARAGGPTEERLYGKEAVLLGIMLASAARMEVHCGHWDRARSLLARASALAQNGAGAKPASLLRLSALIYRLSAQLAIHADGDRIRAIVGYRAALDAARSSSELGNVAETAIHYALALRAEDVEAAMKFVDYGLTIVRRYYPGDRLAELTLEAIPLLLHARGTEAGAEAVMRARSPRLGERDRLFLELAQAKVEAHAGDFKAALDRSDAAAERLFDCGIDAVACDARLVALGAASTLGVRTSAGRALTHSADGLERARAETRVALLQKMVG
ncbi:MAG TPA: hypothetical protein VMF61_04250 [Candidatus Acidoferrales bacterium]|nr:hypothetical protein [Candidatus Acidoferrales bacterium]